MNMIVTCSQQLPWIDMCAVGILVSDVFALLKTYMIAWIRGYTIFFRQHTAMMPILGTFVVRMVASV